jgi:hypothetical protein
LGSDEKKVKNGKDGDHHDNEMYFPATTSGSTPAGLTHRIG